MNNCLFSFYWQKKTKPIVGSYSGYTISQMPSKVTCLGHSVADL